MKPWLLAALLTGTLASNGWAQNADHPRVAVVGEGSAEAAPDFVSVVFSVRGQGSTPAEALEKLKANQGRMEASLGALKGITSMPIVTDGLASTETYPANCRSIPVASSTDCAVTGIMAAIIYSVKVFPAERAGDVVSLATQLGAFGAQTRESGLSQPQKLSEMAASRAFSNAKAQAEQAASAAGMSLGQIVSIQPGNRLSPPLERRVISAAPPPPSPSPIPLGTSFNLKPAPVRQTATVTVEFSLLPKP